MVHGWLHGRQPERDAGQYGKDAEEFAKKLQPDTAQFFPIMVYPGTTAYEEAKKRDYIQIEDWGAWLTKGRSPQQRRHAAEHHTRAIGQLLRPGAAQLLSHPSYLFYKLKQSLKDRANCSAT